MPLATLARLRRVLTAGTLLIVASGSVGCASGYVPTPAAMPMTATARPYHPEGGAVQLKSGLGVGPPDQWWFGGVSFEYAFSGVATLQVDATVARGDEASAGINAGANGYALSTGAALRLSPGRVGEYLWFGPGVWAGVGAGRGWVSPEVVVGASMPNRRFTTFVAAAAGPRIPIRPTTLIHQDCRRGFLDCLFYGSSEEGDRHEVSTETAMSLRGSAGVLIHLSARKRGSSPLSLVLATSVHADPVFTEDGYAGMAPGIAQTIGLRLSFSDGASNSAVERSDVFE